MNMTALRGARERLSELKADAAERPRAVCCICGGIVAERSGQTLSTPTQSERMLDADRVKANRPALAGWGRMHDDCADPAYVVRAITGLRVTHEAASAALRAVHPPVPYVEGVRIGNHRAVFAEYRATLADAVTGWPGRAWAHLSKSETKDFTEIVRTARDEDRRRTEPHKCVQGACGACGVRRSLKWHTSPMRWKDGTPAPWCADCYAVAKRRPDTKDKMYLRAIALEALSGASGMGMAEAFGPDMRLFCEIVDPGHEGTDERWQQAADAWAEIREDARWNLPGSLPVEIRSQYLELIRAANDASDARRRHENAEIERAAMRQAGWIE